MYRCTLIDTVVLLELRKPQRDSGLVAWFEQQRTTDLFVGVISIGEIERGIVRQRTMSPDFVTALATWPNLYGERILPLELKTARTAAAGQALRTASTNAAAG